MADNYKTEEATESEELDEPKKPSKYKSKISVELADKLVITAGKQLEAGAKLRDARMLIVSDIEDLYFNRLLTLTNDTLNNSDARINIPYPILSGQVDTIWSKIDNPPTVTFTINRRKQIAEKVSQAWKQDASSMRAAWTRKDRVEKKMAALSGRAISKVYATSVKNKYKSHYEIVDYRNFYCEGRNGHLEDNMYAGEQNIFKTEEEIKRLADVGVYHPEQVKKLLECVNDDKYKRDVQTYNNNNARGEQFGFPSTGTYAGQKIVNLTEHVMDWAGTRCYILFDPISKIWIRAEYQEEIFGICNYHWTSWAYNEEAFIFWSKGAGDDVMPIAEATKLVLNNALENERRRTQPMRIVEAGQFPDPNQIMDYVPDNVIVTATGKKGEIVTIETPEVSTSINVATFLTNFIAQQTGINSATQGASENDAKVGIFYGQLQQESDRIGLVNKAYSESYAEKAYRYFWGLKTNMTQSIAIQMLGKGGYQMKELTREDLIKVDDVDDVITSGGSREEQLDEVKADRQRKTLAEITGDQETSALISPKWKLKSSLRLGGFNDDDVEEAMDKENDVNRQLLEEADEAIQDILLGETPLKNRGANTSFMQRILDFDTDNLNYIKLDDDGREIGIDKKVYEQSQRLKAYAQAHQEIVIENMQRDLRQQEALAGSQAINIPQSTEAEQNAQIGQANEPVANTPEGTASRSAELTATIAP